MPYRFAQERDDYTDFAAGPVLYSLPGRPAFPVRLASEIFQRCQAHLGRAGPYTVYDPCCGSAYLLVTLAYLHWPAIERVVGSDIDADVMPLAGRNLSLLTLAGVEARIAQLEALYRQYGKPSHEQALASARRLRERLLAYRHLHLIRSQLFAADALSAAAIRSQVEPDSVDLVMTDLPYGQRTGWHIADPSAGAPAWQFLEALRAILTPASIVAITSDKQQKIAHDAYRRVEHVQIGKRRTFFLMLKE